MSTRHDAGNLVARKLALLAINLRHGQSNSPTWREDTATALEGCVETLEDFTGTKVTGLECYSPAQIAADIAGDGPEDPNV